MYSESRVSSDAVQRALALPAAPGIHGHLGEGQLSGWGEGGVEWCDDVCPALL